MDTSTIIAIAVVAVVAVLIIALLFFWAKRRKRRTGHLKDQFGREYEATVEERGRGKAETELAQREDRVRKLEIRPLTRDDHARLIGSWRLTHERFVDDPRMAVGQADRLIGEVMQLRGYPVGDFEQRAADVSVDHPAVVTNYREAHAISVADADGKATTEQLRQAMVHYRALFRDLLETGEDEDAAMPPSRN